MTAEYYREYRVKRREKAAQKAAETVDIKSDLKAALATCAALQKTIAARDATILHLEKLVSQLSVAQGESLARIESGMQVLLARHALQQLLPHRLILLLLSTLALCRHGWLREGSPPRSRC